MTAEVAAPRRRDSRSPFAESYRRCAGSRGACRKGVQTLCRPRASRPRRARRATTN